jgi:hypothetical protein
MASRFTDRFPRGVYHFYHFFSGNPKSRKGGSQIKALLNIFFSVGYCLLATWLGMQLARHIQKITMVRVYLTESEGKLNKLLNYLHDDRKVRGVT